MEAFWAARCTPPDIEAIPEESSVIEGCSESVLRVAEWETVVLFRPVVAVL